MMFHKLTTTVKTEEIEKGREGGGGGVVKLPSLGMVSTKFPSFISSTHLHICFKAFGTYMLYFKKKNANQLHK